MCCTYILSNTLTNASQAFQVVLDATEWLHFFNSLIGVFLLLWGVKLINDLRLRGVDAICGFHARLKVNLKTLKRLARIDSDISSDDKKDIILIKRAATSAFMCLSTRTIKNDLETNNSVHFLSENFIEFSKSVQSIIKLFEESNGQIALSKKMYTDLDELYLTLSDILDSHERNKPFLVKTTKSTDGDLLNNPENIVIMSNYFDSLIDNIIKEIDAKTERLLGKLWKKLN